MDDETVTAEQHIAALREQLQQAQKSAALGELLGTTTHEFNNILMTILNYAKMGMRHKDEPTRNKALDKIHAAAERAAKITGCILSMARKRTTTLEATQLGPVIDEALLLLEREMNKYRIQVDRQIAVTPEVLANGPQIQQVLLNLLVNARQAMPNGGQVVVRLSHDVENQTVDLLVRDSGCGIPPDKLRRIFDRFFTTKSGPDESGKGGTGLGLAMCREIVEAHHGRIRVESTVGKGTAFTIKLPLAPKPSLPRLPGPSANAPVNETPPR